MLVISPILRTNLRCTFFLCFCVWYFISLGFIPYYTLSTCVNTVGQSIFLVFRNDGPIKFSSDLLDFRVISDIFE